MSLECWLIGLTVKSATDFATKRSCTYYCDLYLDVKEKRETLRHTRKVEPTTDDQTIAKWNQTFVWACKDRPTAKSIEIHVLEYEKIEGVTKANKVIAKLSVPLLVEPGSTTIHPVEDLYKSELKLQVDLSLSKPESKKNSEIEDLKAELSRAQQKIEDAMDILTK